MAAKEIAQPVLVTDATGFIGRRLVARLLEAGNQVRALVLPGEDTHSLWPGPVDVIRGDVRRRRAVETAVHGTGTVFHLAAVVSDWGDEALFQRVTVDGTKYVLTAAANAGARAVLASSVVVYSHYIGQDVCHEEHPFGNPLGPYSRSKQAQERLAWEIAGRHGLELSVIRPTNVYGPGCRPWVHDVITQLRRGLPTLVDGGKQNAGLCYVDNAVDGFIRAACNPEAIGRVYNISDGSDVTWQRYISDLAQIISARSPWSLPTAVARPLADTNELLWRILRKKKRPPLTREALNLVSSHHRIPIERARSELGYRPFVLYQEGMKAVAQYIREQGL